MKTVFLVCIFWAAFLCVYCQYRWQENNDNHNAVLKTVYVPLFDNKGSSHVPLKLGKKERQIVSELNQYLLKQQNNPSIPQNGYYNVQVRHFDSPQELTRNFHLKQQLSQINSHGLTSNQVNENSVQDIPYKPILQPAVTPEPEYQQSSQTYQQTPQMHQQSQRIHQQPQPMHQQSQRIHQQPQPMHQQPQLSHKQSQSIHSQPQQIQQQSLHINQKPIKIQQQHQRIQQQHQRIQQQPQQIHLLSQQIQQQPQQVQRQQPQQIHQQSNFLLDTTNQQNYVHNKEQNGQQGRSYTNAILPNTSHYKNSEDIPDTTRTAHDYNSFHQNMVIRYPSANQQNSAEYQKNPTTYNAQSHAVIKTQNSLYQPIQNDYEVDVQPQNPPSATSSIKLHQSPMPLSSTYHSGEHLQANLQAQPPSTFQAYQAALSQQIQPNPLPEQSSQHQLQRTYTQNAYSPIISAPAKSSNLVPVAISQYQTSVSQPVEDYDTPDASVLTTNPQIAQTHQNVYNSYDPKSVGSRASPVHYQSNSQTLTQYASTVPQFHQQYSQESIETDNQSSVYHTHSPTLPHSDTASQPYHDVPDPAHETFTANPRLVYTQPPSNYLYPENQQQYSPNSKAQNVLVVYKSSPNSYAQQPQHFDQQSQVQKFQEESQQVLPKVNFKPLYGYSYN